MRENFNIGAFCSDFKLCSALNMVNIPLFYKLEQDALLVLVKHYHDRAYHRTEMLKNIY